MNTTVTNSKLSPNELLKQADPTLAGTIASTLANPESDRFSEDDNQFLKFHGIYQQDDRDQRKTGKQYIMMVRGRLPGGVVTPEHYLAFDTLATQYANNTLRITSRQGFQFHGVLKKNLGPLIKRIHEHLLTTLAACGDVNRNVMAPPTPATSPLVDEVLENARRLSQALLPVTPAYHEIWIDGVTLDLGKTRPDFADPLYGKTYLPRKFKIAFAIPPLNDVDVHANCLGFIAISEGGKLRGYNVVAGGGMGMSHGNAATFPRLADELGMVAPHQIDDIAKAVLTIHRDFGDRTNRKHARLKYILEDRGVAWFREELERRVGFKLEPSKPYQFTRQGDLFGWHRQSNGANFLGLFVETGRVKDTGDYRLKSGLRAVVERFHLEVRLTPSQNLLLVNVADKDRPAITQLLAEFGIPVDTQAAAIRKASMACVSLPTCGLALAESERALPGVLTRLEGLLGEFGLADEEIVVRMTGCPNGCVRPYLAEIGFVGKAPDKYQIYLGGTHTTNRLNRLYRESVPVASLIDELRPVVARFVKERRGAERFGDFCARVLTETAKA
jgi:sulfite reductase (NADPH) hemoprotein beta-component